MTIPRISGYTNKLYDGTADGAKHGIARKWDMIIAFPPCTYLTSAGTRHYSEKCNPPKKVRDREEKKDTAVRFLNRGAKGKSKSKKQNISGYSKGYGQAMGIKTAEMEEE